ncbi:tyrosinase-like [Pleurodeles waltl]
MMLSLVVLALSLITAAKSQFHPDCSTEAALSNRRCCPVFEGSECGSASGRGSCVQTQLQDPYITDTRCNWPYQQYDHICKCSGNYDGADCGKCKPFYHGADCSEFVPCVRKELRELTAAERKQFTDTLCLAKSTTSTSCVAQTGGDLGDVSTYTFEPTSEYDCIVAVHGSSAMLVKDGDNWTFHDLMHYGPAFGPSHRCLLMRLERLLQQLSGNKSMCLPYWDWTKDGTACSVCTDDLLGKVGSDGRIVGQSCFANWKVGLTPCWGPIMHVLGRLPSPCFTDLGLLPSPCFIDQKEGLFT